MPTDYPNSDKSNPFQSAGDKNPFGDNPYSPPNLTSGQAASVPTDPLPPTRSPGMVRHVPVVAILMIVQGGLEVLMGLGLVAVGGLLPTMMQMEGMEQAEEMPMENMSWFLLFFYGALGVLTLVAAGLHIVAGIRNYGFRGRVLGIVALIGGAVTMFSCYCAPTAIGLGIYGLITYFNPETTEAFALGEAGKKREDISAAFR